MRNRIRRQDWGLYGTGLAVGLMVVITVGLLVGLIWVVARDGQATEFCL